MLNNSTTPKSVNITSAEQLADLDENVSRISISSVVKSRLDLSQRLNLDFLYVEDDRSIDYSLLPSSITTLMIGKYRQSDLMPLQKLTKLNSLRLIFYYSETIDGISKLQNLRYLWIQDANKLTDIKDLSNLNNLRVLIFDNANQLNDIKPISNLYNLLALRLPNNKKNTFSSILFLKNFKALGMVSWHEATIKDGKVKFLASLPAIYDVVFTDSKELKYDSSRNDMKMLLQKNKIERQEIYYKRLLAEGGQAAKMAENYMSIDGTGNTSKAPSKTFKSFNALRKRLRK